MKIAFIGQKGIPTKQGGIEKHVEELSTRLAQADFDVTVYSRPHYTGEKQKTYFYKKVKIINLPSVPTKHLDAISHTLFASIHALFQNYDVIHYHGVGPSLMSFIPRIFNPHAKVIVTFHCIDRQHQKWGGFAKTMLSIGEWTACHFPHETIVVSQTLQKYCRYRFDRETTYLPNGVQTNSSRQSLKILSQLNIKKNNYFLIVSRLIQHKGIHTLIKAYQQASQEVRKNKKLIIVGDGSNTNNYVSYLKELAKNNPDIVFVGQKSGQELEVLFKNAYLFIQPSEAEGLSIALLEAMSYGVPVLISDIEENQEAMDSQGLEFKNKNVNDLAKQLKFAVNHPNFIKEKAKAAKRRVDKKYDWKDITKHTGLLYEQLTTGKKQLIFKRAVK